MAGIRDCPLGKKAGALGLEPRSTDSRFCHGYGRCMDTEPGTIIIKSANSGAIIKIDGIFYIAFEFKYTDEGEIARKFD